MKITSPLLEMMGFAPNTQFRRASPVSPSRVQASASAAELASNRVDPDPEPVTVRLSIVVRVTSHCHIVGSVAAAHPATARTRAIWATR